MPGAKVRDTYIDTVVRLAVRKAGLPVTSYGWFRAWALAKELAQKSVDIFCEDLVAVAAQSLHQTVYPPEVIRIH